MEEFLRKVIEGNGITPPEICLKAFEANFKDAVNIEWFDKESYFEAIFYKNNLEHIALFSKEGLLLEYKVSLPVDFLPEVIKSFLDSKGEIMNIVLRNKGNSIEYEAIIRDSNLTRYLIILTDLGKVIEEKKL